MKKKVLSLILAMVMLSTSVDMTVFASQAGDVDSAVFVEEAAEESEPEDELFVDSEEEPQMTSEVVEEDPEISSRGGENDPSLITDSEEAVTEEDEPVEETKEAMEEDTAEEAEEIELLSIIAEEEETETLSDEDGTISGECGDNLTWTLENGVLTISGTGDMWNYNSSFDVPWYKYNKNMKRLVIENGVTSIGTSAFESCSGFTGDLMIPEGVTIIGNRAFKDCSGFTGDLIIPEGVTIIGNRAFKDCSGFTGRLNIPSSVIEMEGEAFQNCSGLKGKLILPEGITYIGSWIFSGCNGFTGNLVIPEGVTIIGNHAFYGCSGFDGNLTLPSSLEIIFASAFRGCSGLKGNLILPEGVKEIGECAFYDCSGFTGALTIPSNVTGIEWGIFKGCSGFTGSLEIPEGVTYIRSSAFEGCSGFTGGLTIPSSAKGIEWSAFKGCSGFTGGLVIPEDVTYIRSSAFEGCSGFTGSLVISEGVTSIEEYAFIGCSGFTGDLMIPESVTSIGAYAFSGCSGFTGSLVIPKNITSIEKYAFSGCSGFTGSLTLPNNLISIEDCSFDRCNFTGDLIIPEGVTSLGKYAFAECNGFNSIIFQGDAPSIDKYTFYDVNVNVYYSSEKLNWNHVVDNNYGGSLTWIAYEEGTEPWKTLLSKPMASIVSGSVVEQGTKVSLSCSVEEVDIYYTLDGSIPTRESAKYNDSIEINQNIIIKAIAVKEGYKDSEVASFSYSIKGTVETDKILVDFGRCGDNLVWTLDKKGVLTISGTGNMWDNSSPWYGYNTIIKQLVIEDGVESIGTYAFGGCSGLTGNLIIPESVTSIGKSAFNNCSGFTGDLIIPGNVIDIGDHAFVSCSGFTGNLMISEGVTSIGAFAFSDCSGLKGSLIIPDTVTSIGSYAFGSCDGFTGDLIIPESVIDIGDHAFYFCSGFTGDLKVSGNIGEAAFEYCDGFKGNLIIAEKITSIGENAFIYCSGFTGDLIIPDNVINIRTGAFKGCSGFSNNLIILGSTTSIEQPVFSGCNGLNNVIFQADVPNINSSVFAGITLDAYYPLEKAGWDNVIGNNYGGTLTWISYEKGSKPWETNKKLARPTANVNSGLAIQKGKEIVLSCSEEGAEIYYTLDGSTPTQDSEKYTIPIVINQKTTIKAIAVKEGYQNSRIATFDYMMETETTVIDSGKCGDDLTWSLDDNYVLTISGTGDMWNYYHQANGSFNSTPWAEYRETLKQLIIKEGITSIGEGAFQGCDFTGNLIIPDSVVSIGDFAFSVCDGFTGNLIIPKSVTNIGDFAFWACSGFTGDLIIPESVINIGAYAFDGCSDFTGDLIIPKSVRSIGAFAFSYCSGFTGDLIIPESVINIGAYAFSGCSGFTGDLIIPKSVTSIGDFAFYSCSSFNNIVFQENAPDIGFHAFCAVTANAYYPSEKTGWENVVGNQYGGTLTWIAYKEGTTPWEGDSTGSTETPPSGDSSTGSTETPPSGDSSTGGTETPPSEDDSTGDTETPPSDEDTGDVAEDIRFSEVEPQFYTGSAIEPEVQVFDGDKLLEEGTDYTVSYKNNKDVYEDEEYDINAPQIIIKFKGSYSTTETKTIYFNIKAVDISSDAFTAGNLAVKYTGKKQMPKPSLLWNGKKLKYGTDFYVSEYEDVQDGELEFVAAKEYSLTIIGKNNFIGEKTITLTISDDKNQIAMSKVSIKGLKSQSWTGEQIAPDDFKVIYKKKVLEEDIDYKVIYGENKDIGTGTIIITGTGISNDDGYSYIGSKIVTFKITGVKLSKAKIIGVKKTYPYTGEFIRPTDDEVVLKYNKEELTEGTDYTVTYKKNRNKGTATIIFTGMNGYTGTKKKTFKIVASKLGEATIVELPDENLDGEDYVFSYLKGGVTPKVEVKDGDTSLVEGKDYTVSYKNNKKKALSTAKKAPTIIIKGKGNYRGSKKVYFTIQ